MQHLNLLNVYFATTIDSSEKANFRSALFMLLGADRSLSGITPANIMLKFERKRGGLQPVLVLFSDEYGEDVNYLRKQSNVRIQVKNKWFNMRVQYVQPYTNGGLGSTLN